MNLCKDAILENPKCGKVHPKLLQSVQVIYAHRLQQASRQEELLYNFRVSTRGSIRKAPHIMTWVTSLRKLSSYGECDVAEAIGDKASDKKQLQTTIHKRHPISNSG